jgi:pyruvate/2-oxoglutarate dehydrogenase complex dihydrolipoamide dehydrogenase (E3) component
MNERQEGAVYDVIVLGAGPVGQSAHVATADSHAVPQVFFTDPEAAAVGLAAEQAERRGHRVQVVDLDHGHLLGATFVGAGVAELLQSATVAAAGRVPIQRLWHAVPCFPTISELWLRLLEAHRDSQPNSTEKVDA